MPFPLPEPPICERPVPAMDNIVLTSTNAAKALEQVMPEIARIGSMANYSCGYPPPASAW